MPEVNQPIDQSADFAKKTGEVFERLASPLRLIATRLVKSESTKSIEADDLISEAFIRLIDHQYADFLHVDEPRQLALLSTVMRRILIDHARKRTALKRGTELSLGDLQRGIELHRAFDRDFARQLSLDDHLFIQESLDRLATLDPIAREVVDLQFCGYTAQEIALLQKRNTKSVRRDLDFAKTFMRARLS